MGEAEDFLEYLMELETAWRVTFGGGRGLSRVPHGAGNRLAGRVWGRQTTFSSTSWSWKPPGGSRLGEAEDFLEYLMELETAWRVKFGGGRGLSRVPHGAGNRLAGHVWGRQRTFSSTSWSWKPPGGSRLGEAEDFLEYLMELETAWRVMFGGGRGLSRVPHGAGNRLAGRVWGRQRTFSSTSWSWKPPGGSRLGEAEDFLEYLMELETAWRVAFGGGRGLSRVPHGAGNRLAGRVWGRQRTFSSTSWSWKPPGGSRLGEAEDFLEYLKELETAWRVKFGGGRGLSRVPHGAGKRLAGRVWGRQRTFSSTSWSWKPPGGSRLGEAEDFLEYLMELETAWRVTFGGGRGLSRVPHGAGNRLAGHVWGRQRTFSSTSRSWKLPGGSSLGEAEDFLEYLMELETAWRVAFGGGRGLSRVPHGAGNRLAGRVWGRQRTFSSTSWSWKLLGGSRLGEAEDFFEYLMELETAWRVAFGGGRGLSRVPHGAGNCLAGRASMAGRPASYKKRAHSHIATWLVLRSK